mmetsp:Transcript_29927/g.97054  ORF Transcript_29927/g.97054 Transcript_29927/m.97054 type:complete len:222 (+) Transcript_29927:536-1201(+)
MPARDLRGRARRHLLPVVERRLLRRRVRRVRSDAMPGGVLQRHGRVRVHTLRGRNVRRGERTIVLRPLERRDHGGFDGSHGGDHVSRGPVFRCGRELLRGVPGRHDEQSRRGGLYHGRRRKAGAPGRGRADDHQVVSGPERRRRVRIQRRRRGQRAIEGGSRGDAGRGSVQLHGGQRRHCFRGPRHHQRLKRKDLVRARSELHGGGRRRSHVDRGARSRRL